MSKSALDASLLTGACFLGWLLLTAGVEKVARPTLHATRMRAALFGYAPPPKTVALLGGIEFLLGLYLLLGLALLWFDLVLAALGVAFLVAALLALGRGVAGDCSCGGLNPSRSFGPEHAALNSLILAVSLVLVANAPATLGRRASGDNGWGLQGLAAAVTLGVLLLLAAAGSVRAFRQWRIAADRRVLAYVAELHDDR